MHLAAAAGVPTVGIFGPTNPAVWGPAGPGHLVVRHIVPCQPCYKDDGVLPGCAWAHRCMRDLDVPEVEAAVTAVLEARQR
jgi:ADP-heptose:LPS heptosyltransferase